MMHDNHRTTISMVLLLLFAVAGAQRSTITTSANGWLSNWMGLSMDVIGNQTLLDLSLPGTHDTMTYDLSETVGDGGIDGQNDLSELLNYLGTLGIGDDLVGSFVRDQARTQASNITTQLNAGVRFLDFRVMFQYSSEKEWYCLHCVESKQPALEYLREVRQWLDVHPSEVIVIWFSKHGDTTANGTDQYPHTSVEQKQAFWTAIKQIFDGLLMDTTVSSVVTTPLSELVARKHRTVVWASDWSEFTGRSTYAMDGASIQNDLEGSIGSSYVARQMSDFRNASARKAELKSQGRFYLYSLASGTPDAQAEDAAKLTYLPNLVDGVMKTREDCAASFHIPNMTNWCPLTLLDLSQLSNYYSQIALSAVGENEGWDFPNAIYIDAVDVDGTIRTGTQRIGSHEMACDVYEYSDCVTSCPTNCDGDGPNWTANGHKEHGSVFSSAGHEKGICALPWQNHYQCCRVEPDGHDTARFGYADTVVYVNVRRACGSSGSPACKALLAQTQERLQLHPKKLWSDPQTGRHETTSAIDLVSFAPAL